MKARNGFVSNSSSSSFVIPLDELTGKELRMLEQLDNTSVGSWGCHWSITTLDTMIKGYTTMDNGGMEEWMKDHNMEHLVQYIRGD